MSNELELAMVCSSSDHRLKTISLQSRNRNRMGYPPFLNRPNRSTNLNPLPLANNNNNKKQKETALRHTTLNTQLVSDTVNHNIKHILKKHKILTQLTNKRSTAILQLGRKIYVTVLELKRIQLFGSLVGKIKQTAVC